MSKASLGARTESPIDGFDNCVTDASESFDFDKSHPMANFRAQKHRLEGTYASQVYGQEAEPAPVPPAKKRPRPNYSVNKQPSVYSA